MTTKSMIFLCLALGSSAALSAQSDRKTDTLGKEMKVRKEVKIIVEEDGTERRTEKIITTKSNKSDIVNEDKDVKIELNTKKNDPKKYSVRGNRRTKLYLDMATGINILSQQNSVIGRFYPEQDLWRSWFFDIGFVFKTRLNTSVASPITFNYGINFMLNHRIFSSSGC